MLTHINLHRVNAPSQSKQTIKKKKHTQMDVMTIVLSHQVAIIPLINIHSLHLGPICLHQYLP